MSSFHRQSLSEQIGTYYADHHDELDPITLGDLAAHVGSTRTTTRKGVRHAEDILIGKDTAIRVPNRGNGHTIAAETDHLQFLVSTSDRLRYITKELVRYNKMENAVAPQGADLLYDSICQAVEQAMQDWSARLLGTTP